MSMKIFNLVYYDVNRGKQGVYASFKNDFNYELENKDIFYLETIISELVQDYHEYDSSQVDILVCA